MGPRGIDVWSEGHSVGLGMAGGGGRRAEAGAVIIQQERSIWHLHPEGVQREREGRGESVHEESLPCDRTQ